MAYVHLRVRTGERDLHSGLFGGAALNAANSLAQMLAAVVARDGRLPEPLRAGHVNANQSDHGVVEMLNGFRSVRFRSRGHVFAPAFFC